MIIMANRIIVKRPKKVEDNMPGGSEFIRTNAHLVYPFCQCDDKKCQARKKTVCSLSGGGSKWGEIGGVAAAVLESGVKTVGFSGCSAGSIITCLIASGAAIGVPSDSMLRGLEIPLNETLSVWPWKRKKQLYQRKKLLEWIDEYWELCAVKWGTEGRIRNLMAHMVRLCAPCNNDWSWFSPSWEDPWTVTLFLKTIFCGGVNDNQKVFANVSKLLPEKFYKGPEWLCNASILAVDAWMMHPYQAILDWDNEYYDCLGPHREEWIDTATGDYAISPGKNPACAGITYCDPKHKVVDVVAASCAIPALMKFVRFPKDPKCCLSYKHPDVAEMYGYPPVGDIIDAEFLDGGLWQTMPIFQMEAHPTRHLDDPYEYADGTESISVFSPYMSTTMNIYSHPGNDNWIQRHYIGDFRDRPKFFGRWIGARVGTVVSTMHNCSTWDQIMDQARHNELGGKSTLTCTEFGRAKEVLLKDLTWGSDTYYFKDDDGNLLVDHSELPDIPDSRTMKDGWSDKLMITDVFLGYLSAKLQKLV